ncbi:MAG: hypothetical protein ACP5R6_05625 [Chlorobaculum sp.]
MIKAYYPREAIRAKTAIGNFDWYASRNGKAFFVTRRAIRPFFSMRTFLELAEAGSRGIEK